MLWFLTVDKAASPPSDLLVAQVLRVQLLRLLWRSLSPSCPSFPNYRASDCSKSQGVALHTTAAVVLWSHQAVVLWNLLHQWSDKTSMAGLHHSNPRCRDPENDNSKLSMGQKQNLSGAIMCTWERNGSPLQMLCGWMASLTYMFPSSRQSIPALQVHSPFPSCFFDCPCTSTYKFHAENNLPFRPRH